MDITEYREWSQKAQAMTEDQQRACIHNFSNLVLVEEIWARMEWLSLFQTKQTKLQETFSMENYHKGPYVENSYIREVIYGEEPKKKTAEVIEDLKKEEKTDD